MENGCGLLYFIIVISLKSLSIMVRTINHSLWSPFYTQKNFIVPGRKMSSNSPAQIQKSQASAFQVYVAAITLTQSLEGSVWYNMTPIQCQCTKSSVLQLCPLVDKGSWGVGEGGGSISPTAYSGPIGNI